MSITAKELAEKLGVSRSTISMVYNNKKGISEDTRTMVLQGAQKYGYHHTQRKRLYELPSVIQYIIFVQHGEIVNTTAFFSSVLQGIESQSKKLGYTLQISYFYAQKNSEKQLQRILDTNPCGLIILATEMTQEDIGIFEQARLPLVVLDCSLKTSAADCIVISNIQSAYQATSYLIECGHTYIGCLSSKTACKNFEDRLFGFQMAIQQYAATSDIRSAIVKSEIEMESYSEDLSNYIKNTSELPTAFFADNDVLAVNLVKALKDNGYRVPEDVSVIGFDDMPFDQLLDPPLSSMNVSKESFGKRAVLLLDQQIHEQSNDHVKVEVDTTLVKRKSVIKRSHSIN